MKKLRNLAAVATVLGLVLFMAACENSDLLAPSTGQIILRATPSEVIIDVAGGQQSGTTSVSAQVFDEDGFPLEGISVTFSTDAGVLADTVAVESDQNGVARTTLTFTLNDAQSATVSAFSATLTDAIPVGWSVIAGNQEPFADIEVDPALQQAKGKSVTFDGNASTDPDGDSLTCFKWTIQGSAYGVQVFQGQTRSVLTVTFPNEDSITATLFVSDDPDVFSDCGASDPPIDDSRLSPGSAVVSNYPIVCDISNPVADAGSGNQTASLAANGGSVSVFVDGSGSVEPDNSIVEYRWTCGNATPPVLASTHTCTYTSQGSYRVELRVTNECGQTDTDFFTMNVVP